MTYVISSAVAFAASLKSGVRKLIPLFAAATLAVLGSLTSPASSVSAAASTGRCPAGATGGPTLRICSANLFGTQPNQPIEVDADVILPCTTSDLVIRKVPTSAKPTKTTTDSGSAYLSVYPSTGEQLEVGFTHLADPVRYKLYVRHGTTWQSPGTFPCGVNLYFGFYVSYDNQSGLQPLPTYLDAFAGLASNAATVQDYYFDFPGTCVAPGSGKGCISPLTNAAWKNACPTCRAGQLTTIAQNGNGSVPKSPLPDGASFGPVQWDEASYVGAPSSCTGVDCEWVSLPWAAAQNDARYYYATPHVVTTTGTDGWNGYAASLTLSCVASTNSSDSWSCPPTY